MTPQQESSAGPKPLRVLVVEDDADALSALVEILLELGHWATGVRSAEIAKDRFFANAFDVLMTDVGLPALSGFDLAESLRVRHKVEVIFVSGQQQPESLPADSLWLPKPFSVEQLEAALEASRARIDA